MCGIMGGNIKNINYEQGINVQRHRGPDGTKVMTFQDCTFAFTRLAIMDLSEKAMQPFCSPDKNVIMVYNGEIYNYLRLRNKLKEKYIFETTSDTEVILYSYLEYGDSFIEYIDGMFAIAIYDKRIKQLKLYRDRYGIKPLYYYYKNNKFAFSSELKGIEAAFDNKIKLSIDNTAIYDYLVYQYIPEPKSMYKNVYKLEPATYIHYDLENKKIIKKEEYWKLQVNDKKSGNRKKKNILGDVKELIGMSVKQQMIADVPVGTFLSGGVDSSIISYECHKNNSNISAYTIGFSEKNFDESSYAEIVAKCCNIKSNVKIITSNDIQSLKGTLRSLYDEPFADTSAFPTYILSGFAKQGISVVLTGDGGDELFGGYDRYKLFYERRKNKLVKEECLEEIIKRILYKKTYCSRKILNKFESELTTYAQLVGIFEGDKYSRWRKILGIDKEYDEMWYLKKYYHNDLPPMTRMRYLDFKTYLPSDILTKVDRASMRVSLETRVPFLNKDLVEYVFGLAEDECYYQNELKILLKEAYSNVLPKEILYRNKRGFSIPAKYIQRGSDTKYSAILKQEWSEIVNGIETRYRKEKVFDNY